MNANNTGDNFVAAIAAVLQRSQLFIKIRRVKQKPKKRNASNFRREKRKQKFEKLDKNVEAKTQDIREFNERQLKIAELQFLSSNNSFFKKQCRNYNFGEVIAKKKRKKYY